MDDTIIVVTGRENAELVAKTIGEFADRIKALPTIQPVATDIDVGDKISRQQAIELIKNYCENGCDIAEDNWCPSCQREQFMKLLKALPTAQPEDYTELKREFLRMASYIDVLLECSDEQKETLNGFISRLAEFMPWTERD